MSDVFTDVRFSARSDDKLMALLFAVQCQAELLSRKPCLTNAVPLTEQQWRLIEAGSPGVSKDAIMFAVANFYPVQAFRTNPTLTMHRFALSDADLFLLETYDLQRIWHERTCPVSVSAVIPSERQQQNVERWLFDMCEITESNLTDVLMREIHSASMLPLSIALRNPIPSAYNQYRDYDFVTPQKAFDPDLTIILGHEPMSLLQTYPCSVYATCAALAVCVQYLQTHGVSSCKVTACRNAGTEWCPPNSIYYTFTETYINVPPRLLKCTNNGLHIVYNLIHELARCYPKNNFITSVCASFNVDDREIVQSDWAA